MKRVGIDIGGTKIECVILDGDGHVMARERVPTERDNGYKHILGQISKLYNKLSDQLSDEFLFGVCVPGPLTADGDRLKHGNTQALVGEPLKDEWIQGNVETDYTFDPIVVESTKKILKES